jgi:GNAT superfamily N-acetyltransferase
LSRGELPRCFDVDAAANGVTTAPSVRPREVPPRVVVRRARASDAAAAVLVVDSAPLEFGALAGSRESAVRVLSALWPRAGHSFNCEHSWVADLDGVVVGVLVGFAERDRIRLHAVLAVRALRQLPVRRRLLLPAVLVLLRLLTPRPPRDAFYVAAIAVASHARRRGIASALGEAAVAHARTEGFGCAAAHTGTRHRVARRGLERFGGTARHARRGGYVLYTMLLGSAPAHTASKS